MNVEVQDGRKKDIYINHELDDLGLDPYEFRIYGRLARRASTPKGAYESVSEMARGCRMSERSVHQALRSLEERCLIRKTSRPGTTSVYHLLEKTEWRTPAPDADPPLQDVQTTSAPDADKGLQGKASNRKEPPSPPKNGKANNATLKAEGEDETFDPQALRRLQREDRELHKRLVMRANSLKWQFTHQTLAAMHALRDGPKTIAALDATIEGADSKGAKAYKYFKSVLDGNGPTKNGQAKEPDQARAMRQNIGRLAKHREFGVVEITSVALNAEHYNTPGGPVKPEDIQWLA